MPLKKLVCNSKIPTEAPSPRQFRNQRIQHQPPFSRGGEAAVIDAYKTVGLQYRNILIVDMAAKRTIEDDCVMSKCGWTPFAGRTVTGWPKGTIIRGKRVMWEDEILGAAGGEPVRFVEALSV